MIDNKMDIAKNNDKYDQPGWQSPEYIESRRVLCKNESILNSTYVADQNNTFRKIFVPSTSKSNYLYNYPIANKCSNLQ